jgi:hypothetical protein
MEIDHKLYPLDAESGIELKYNLPDRCLHIFDIKGNEARIDADDEACVRAAVMEYEDSGVEKLLDFIVVPSGAEFTIKVSRIADWVISTSNSRLISRTVQNAVRKADKANSLFEDYNG